jgi:hypothetical protein
MRERFERAWSEQLQRARQWRSDDDPTPVLDALALSSVRYLVGTLEMLPRPDRETLRAVAGPALGAARRLALASEDDREAWLQAVALAEWSLRLLELGPARAADPVAPEILAALPGELRRPTPRRLVALLEGRLDGLAAASCVVWYLRHDPAEPRWLWSLAVQQDLHRPATATTPNGIQPMLVAAAGPVPMREPGAGRVIAQWADPGVELVWFEADRQLALYALEESYVALTAPGVTPCDLRPGYWLGDVVSSGATALQAEVTVGDRVLSIELALG